MLWNLIKALLALFKRAPAKASSETPQPSSKTPADLLRAAMDRAGILDNDTRAGVAAIVKGESDFKPRSEASYAHTPNDRIRAVFGSRMVGMTDGAISVLKSDDKQFFNYVYGPQFAAGRSLGNTQPSDGYRFRGRGLLQITGRANYTKYGTATGKLAELMTDPDLANDPAIAAELAVAYIKDRYKGGGWDALLACVGNNTADIRATKTRYYQQFKASGEFNKS
jgi:predicted chitinase